MRTVRNPQLFCLNPVALYSIRPRILALFSISPCRWPARRGSRIFDLRVVPCPANRLAALITFLARPGKSMSLTILVARFRNSGPMASGSIIDFVVPSVDDGLVVDIGDAGHEAPLEFLLGADADVPQYRARQLGEEAFDEIEPGAMGRRESEGEAPDRLLGEPGCGFA